MKFIILTGPTASGKTSLSIELAKILNSEILSADSMQIYKEMNIGTDKISKIEMQGIKHHLIDIVYPNEEYTVDDYKNDASFLIHKLNAENKMPIVVGGTGLYLDSLIYDLNFSIAPPNPDLRQYYEDLANSRGNAFIHNLLSRVDPKTASKYHPNQMQRMVRALEVYDYTGKPMSSFDTNRKYMENISFKYLVLNRPREVLYEKINQRVEEMFEDGLVREIERLLNSGYSPLLKSMQAIGYKEILSAFAGEISLEEAKELIKRNSRRYAKRQLTWFRREKSAVYIDIEKKDTDEDIISRCLREIEVLNDL